MKHVLHNLNKECMEYECLFVSALFSISLELYSTVKKKNIVIHIRSIEQIMIQMAQLPEGNVISGWLD